MSPTNSVRRTGDTIWRANWRAGAALVRSTWLSWMQARSFFFLVAFGWMVPPLIYLFVWSTVAGEEGAGGMGRDEFIVYYLLLILVNQVTYAQTNWTVGDTIRTGDFSRLLLYPMSPIFNTVASELAGKVVMLSFVGPATLLLALWLRPQVTFTWQGVVLFVPALLLAWLLRFFWGYWLALLAFWSTRADALLAGLLTLYAVFLLFTSLMFWSPGFLFTWVFNGIFQMARYPVGVYPGFLRLVLTWVIPIGVMTTIPALALTGEAPAWLLLVVVMFAAGAFLGASWVFRRALRQYASASS